MSMTQSVKNKAPCRTKHSECYHLYEKHTHYTHQMLIGIDDMDIEKGIGIDTDIDRGKDMWQ